MRRAIGFLVGWFLGALVGGQLQKRRRGRDRPSVTPREWDVYVRAENGALTCWVYFREWTEDPREAERRVREIYASTEEWRAREIRIYPAESWWIRVPV